MATTTDDIDGEAETSTVTAEETSSGMDENVAGALSYLFGFVTGLIFFLIEKENDYVRFHAAQSIAVWGLLFVAYIGLSFVGTIFSTVLFSSSSTFIIGSLVSLVLGLAWLVLGLGGFALWVYLMVRAYQGKTPRVPIAAGIADKLV